MLRREIENLRARMGYKGSNLSGMPKGGTGHDFTDQIAEIADLEAILRANLNRADRERIRLESYIEAIPDSEIRLIFRLRHINCMSWESVGESLHMDRTTAERKHGAYLQGQNGT